jgi:hypothetical protein
LEKFIEKGIDKPGKVWYNRSSMLYAVCCMLDSVYWKPVLKSAIGSGLGHRCDYHTRFWLIFELIDEGRCVDST